MADKPPTYTTGQLCVTFDIDREALQAAIRAGLPAPVTAQGSKRRFTLAAALRVGIYAALVRAGFRRRVAIAFAERTLLPALQHPRRRVTVLAGTITPMQVAIGTKPVVEALGDPEDRWFRGALEAEIARRR